ncbi:hypothetical protein BAB42_04695 [Salmonella enterica subsp. enterica serovar Poano]|nr:hypothetical protein [Salmonella enterica]EBW2599160.1 hypothetical protein [Salmonella enterica subsp. enterica serovar Poano]ECD2093477.1 hypothetical protein [Salmonella enterica subsp. enterica serovar Poano]ECS5197167.1 hypothetical protein [Salmonella enterica subsp. enterica serovar Poano]
MQVRRYRDRLILARGSHGFFRQETALLLPDRYGDKRFAERFANETRFVPTMHVFYPKAAFPRLRPVLSFRGQN